MFVVWGTLKERKKEKKRSLLPLRTTTSLLIQSVGSVTFLRTCIFSNSSMCAFSSAFSGMATLLGVCFTGVMFGSTSKWYSPGRHPKPSNTSLYLMMISSGTVAGEMSTLFAMCTVISPILVQVSPDNRGCRDPWTILKLSRCCLSWYLLLTPCNSV